MTESEDVKEIIPPGEPMPETNDINIPNIAQPTQSKVSCGYAVLLHEDNSISFDILGLNPDIIRLLGLHEVAKEKLKTSMDQELGGKFTMLHNLIKELKSE